MYIQRKISKLKSKVILPPIPEEILEDDFNYPDYVQKALNFEIDFDEVKKLYNNLAPSTHPNQNIQKLYQEFEKQIIEIQKKYEKDLKNNQITINYNQEMKKIAKAYIKASKSFTHQKLLTDKSKEDKEKIENTSLSRIKDFNQDKLPIGKLYIYDLSHVPPIGIKIDKRMILLALREKITSEFNFHSPYETLNELKRSIKK